jgi:AmmeMemoRadiSam system protein B
MFYPADADDCREMAARFLRDAADRAGADPQWLGGIVPHAGWICSGAIAGRTIAAIAAGTAQVDLVVIFGAVHTPLPIDAAALDSHGRWQVPGGECDVPRELERKLIESSTELFGIDDRFHVQEHAVEVELPLVREAWPSAAVLPVEVPLIEGAVEIGRRTAREAMAANLRPIFLASSDLTHYGVNYGFAPAGLGRHGLQWAKDNDRRLLDLVTAMKVDDVMPEVSQRYNACGGGAIAAMMAACREYGAGRGRLLSHANSYETLAEVAPQSPNNAVGYAAVVVG